MTIVYKVCGSDEWNAAEAQGSYAGSSDDRRDGFIHLSAAHQLQGTLEKYFAGRDGLALIAYEETNLDGLKWEPSRGGDLFPHVYGALDPVKALWVKDLPLIAGRHRLPAGLVA